MSRKTLDALIRAKLATLGDCSTVEPLPVTWNGAHNGHGCNWAIPGWVGEAIAVERCVRKLEHYLDFLREQFDIAPDRSGAD